jgi:hypothetical protein
MEVAPRRLVVLSREDTASLTADRDKDSVMTMKGVTNSERMRKEQSDWLLWTTWRDPGEPTPVRYLLIMARFSEPLRIVRNE